MDKPTLGLSTALTSGPYGLQSDKPSTTLSSLLQSLSLNSVTFQQQLQRFTHKQQGVTNSRPLLTTPLKAGKVAPAFTPAKAVSSASLREAPAGPRPEASSDLEVSESAVNVTTAPQRGQSTQTDALNSPGVKVSVDNDDTPTETVVEEASAVSANAASQVVQENQSPDAALEEQQVAGVNDKTSGAGENADEALPTVSPEILAALLTQLPQLLQLVAATPPTQCPQGLDDVVNGQDIVTPIASGGNNVPASSALVEAVLGGQTPDKSASLVMVSNAHMPSTDCLTVVGQVGMDVLAVPATTVPQTGEAADAVLSQPPTLQPGQEVVSASTPSQVMPSYAQDHLAGVQALLSVVAQLSPQELSTVTIEQGGVAHGAIQHQVVPAEVQRLMPDEALPQTESAVSPFPIASVETVSGNVSRPSQPTSTSQKSADVLHLDLAAGNDVPRATEMMADLPSQAQSNTSSDESASQFLASSEMPSLSDEAVADDSQETLPQETMVNSENGPVTTGSVSVAPHSATESAHKTSQSSAPSSGTTATTPTPLPQGVPVPAESRRLTLHLAPQSLGQVEVILTKAANGEVSAKVRVHSAQAHTRLRQELVGLTQKLHLQGIDPQQVELTLAPAAQQEQTQKLRLMGPTAQEWTQQLQAFEAASPSGDSVQATSESFQATDQGDLGRDGGSREFSQGRDDGLSSQAGLGGQFSQQFQQHQDAALFETLQPVFNPASGTDAANQIASTGQEPSSLMASDLAANQLLTGLDLPSNLATAYTAYTIFGETSSQVLFSGDDNPLEMDARLLVGT